MNRPKQEWELKTTVKKQPLLVKLLQALFTQARQWCQGRFWQLRLLLLFFFLDSLVRHLRDPLYQSIFKGLDLGLHELGHFLFEPFGQFLQVAGGSIFQCLVPLIAMIMFYRQKDFYAIAIAFGWLGENFFDVGVYITDAREQKLPLVSPIKGDEIIHDWNYILSTLHMERYDYTLGSIVSGLGIVCYLICLSFGGWLLWNMITTKSAREFDLE